MTQQVYIIGLHLLVGVTNSKSQYNSATVTRFKPASDNDTMVVEKSISLVLVWID